MTLMTKYNSMVFYQSWYDIAKGYGDDFLNRACRELLEYGLFGTVPDNSDDPVMRMFFDMAKPNIDSNIERKMNGKKGGRPPKKTKTSGLTSGLSNVDVDADVNADADADTNVNDNLASPTPSDSALEGQSSGEEISPEEARKELERYEHELRN